MFRVKNLFVILVVNVFAFCAFTIISEYLNLGYTFTQLRSTIDTCADSAAQTAMLSEEFFGVSSTGQVYSEAQSLGSVVYYSSEDGNWVRVNPFVLARYFDENGKFPSSQDAVDSLTTSNPYDDYGSVGLFSYFYADSLASLSGTHSLPSVSQWMSGSATTVVPEASSEFKDFAKAVCYNGVTTARGIDVPSDYTGMASLANVYHKGIGGTMQIEKAYVPSLARMGLKIFDVNSLGNWLNFDFVYPLHKTNGNGVYMLTPSSLGVTYIEPRVYKSTFMANLDQRVRLNKVKITPVDERRSAYGDASGCVSTSVYSTNSDPDTILDTSLEHIDSVNGGLVTSSSSIVNDGLVEYDMDSVQVRVQYRVIDVTDDTNKHIVEQVAGAPEGYNGTTSLGDAFEDNDTSVDNISIFARRRVIARVSTRIKVYIPYKAPILQWLVQDSSEDNHFSIAKVEEDSEGNKTFLPDGLWYEHIQYVGILR